MYDIKFYKDKNGNLPVLQYLRDLASKKDKDSNIKLQKIRDYIAYLRKEGKGAGIMNDTAEYKNAITQAKANLSDLHERGADAIGESWDDIENELFTEEEIAASDLRVALMIKLTKTRKERGISQKKLEELSGVKQPVIARMERGLTSPQIETVIKVLTPLGMTLAIVPAKQRA